MNDTLEFPPIAAPALRTEVATAAAGALDLEKINLTDLALAKFGDWRGAVAAVKANLGSLALDLSTQARVNDAKSLRERLINVHPGMYLVSSNTDGTSGSVDANPTHVTAVNYEAGTITTDATTSWATAAGGFSNDDYLFPQGAFGSAFYGIDSWVPSTAPSDTFLGQSRAANPVLLGGVRYTASAGSPDGTIQRAFSNAAIEGKKWGARPDVIMMNIDNFGALTNEIEGRIEYTSALARRGGYGEKDAEVDVGILGVRITLPTNPGCLVVPDNDCPRDVAYMLDFRTIAFHGVGMTEPEWLNPAGTGRWHNMLSDDIDGMEALMGIYGNPSYGLYRTSQLI